MLLSSLSLSLVKMTVMYILLSTGQKQLGLFPSAAKDCNDMRHGPHGLHPNKSVAWYLSRQPSRLQSWSHYKQHVLAPRVLLMMLVLQCTPLIDHPKVSRLVPALDLKVTPGRQALIPKQLNLARAKGFPWGCMSDKQHSRALPHLQQSSQTRSP